MFFFLKYLLLYTSVIYFYIFIMKIVHKVQTKNKKQKEEKTKANPYGSSLHAAQ